MFNVICLTMYKIVSSCNINFSTLLSVNYLFRDKFYEFAKCHRNDKLAPIFDPML